MYPCYFDEKAAETPEILAFWADCEAVGVVNDLEQWHITPESAEKFQRHLLTLTPHAEGGNPLAQYSIAAILMIGYCYASAEQHLANHDRDAAVMTSWLVRCARQGLVAAVDNLVTSGVGPEAERLRAIAAQVSEETKCGNIYPPGEAWRRAYGVAVSEG